MSTQIKEFCDKHAACGDGRAWAPTHCKDMAEVWQTARPNWLVWVATRKGVLTENELRRFAVWSARQVQHLMNDERSIHALDVAERYANGDATDEELAAAYAAARAAYDASADYATDAVFATDASFAAHAARAAIVNCAAHVAAYAAGRAAVHTAADAAACVASQAQWLRENTKPNFA